jgi:hypothetical protein
MTSQDGETAKDLMGLWDALERTMPRWMRQRREEDAALRVRYRNGSIVAARAPGRRAGRSIDAQLFFADEAAFIPDLQTQLRAAEPAVEAAHGLCALASTSDGLGTHFARLYLGNRQAAQEGRRGKYSCHFAGYQARPGRDAAWWERQMAANRDDPLTMLREYPRNEEEAFRSAGGLVYNVTADHLVVRERPANAPIYRSFDWGDTTENPFVCVWAWHDETQPPGLAFHPDANVLDLSPDIANDYVNGLDELWAYKRAPNTGEPLDKNNHFCDALRYLTHGLRLFGYVYVYRVLVIRPGAIKPMDPLGALQRVIQLSGWEPVAHGRWTAGRNVEPIRRSIGDPAGKTWIDLAHAHTRRGVFNLRIQPYTHPPGRKKIAQGILWNTALLKGTYPRELEQHVGGRQARGSRTEPQTIEESLAKFGEEIENPTLARRVLSRYRP